MSETERKPSSLHRFIRQWLFIRENELQALIWSFFYFFCLLCSYYILRPFRDEMGIAGGVENLQWLFTGTFLTMLAIVPVFGFLTRRYQRRKLLPYIYLFFVLNILLFFMLFEAGVNPKVLAPTFFIWLSVFNLFVVSVFWSFMTDIFTNEQSKRMFGIIAAGGSAGAITGPAITAFLSQSLGPITLLPISAVLLGCAMLCISRLTTWSKNKGKRVESPDKPIGGSIWAGFHSVIHSQYLIGIGLFVMLYTTVSTFLYFEQAHIVEQAFDDPADRTSLFAGIDFATNSLAITSQAFLTSRVIRSFGVAIMLASVPTIVLVGFVGLSLWTVLPMLIVVQIVHRAGNFSLLRPGKEILFTVTNLEERYKAKNFIDTALYRGGDALTGWAFTGLMTLGFTLSTIAAFAVPLAGIWGLTGFLLGRKQEEKKAKQSSDSKPK